MTAVDVFVLFAACASTFVIIVCSIIHGQLFSILPTMIQYMYACYISQPIRLIHIGLCSQPL